MDLDTLTNKIKEQFHSGADKFLSAKVKEELGLNKPTVDSLMSLSGNHSNLEASLNSFYKPVHQTFLSSKDYKNLRNGIIAFVVVLVLVLLFLFFSVILPQKDYSNPISQQAQIMVNGNPVKSNFEEEKILVATEETDNQEAETEIKTRNIPVSTEGTKKLALDSPLLKGTEKSAQQDYTIKSGDTLESIAKKFYGSYNTENIEKIKKANFIRNAKLIRAGQKLIIPAG